MKKNIALISLATSLSLFATAATSATATTNSASAAVDGNQDPLSITTKKVVTKKIKNDKIEKKSASNIKSQGSSSAASSALASSASKSMVPSSSPNSVVSGKASASSSPAKSASTTVLPATASLAAANPAAPTQTQNMKAPAVPKAAAKPDSWGFSGVLDITREAQLKNQEDGTRAEGLGFDLLPKVSYGKYSATLWLSYSKDLKDPTGSDWADPVILLGRAPWDMGKYFKFGLSFLGMVPYSKASTDIKQYKGSLGIINNFILNSEALGVKDLSTNLSIGLTGNYFDSTTDIKGEPLNQYSVNQKFNIGYALGDFSISAYFWHYSRFSYENVVRESFNHGQELGYNFNSHFNVAIGAYNEAPMYKGPAYDFNLKAVDDTSTKIYAKTEFVW